MSLPNVAEVLTEWAVPTLIKTVTQTTVDFEPVTAITGRTQDCVIQVAEKERLNPDTIDWSKEYLMVHSAAGIVIDEYVEYQGRDYKVVDRNPYGDYGYTEVVAEETKEPLLEVNA